VYYKDRGLFQEIGVEEISNVIKNIQYKENWNFKNPYFNGCMRNVLEAKFAQNPDLLERLLKEKEELFFNHRHSDHEKALAFHLGRIRENYDHLRTTGNLKNPMCLSLYDSFKEYQVTAKSAKDFSLRYYKEGAYQGRGADYVECVDQSRIEDIQKNGFSFITHHDSKTGETVSYYGKANELDY